MAIQIRNPELADLLLPDMIGAAGPDPNAIHVNVAAEIAGIAAKAVPVAADLVVIEDSAAANAKKSVQVGNLPGGVDPNAIHVNVAAEIAGIAAKAVPIATDLIVIEDSAAANAKKSVQLGNLPTGAPAAAQYLTLALDGTLTAERVFTPVDGLQGVDGGANANYSLSSGLPFKAVPDDPPDDMFDQGVGGLDVRWTAVSGGVGVVDLLEAGNVAEYDLTTRVGNLLLQVGSAIGNKVELRQDYTLPAEKSIILALYPSLLFDAAIVNNELWIGFGQNNNDAGYDAGVWQALFFDANANNARIISHGTIAAGATEGICGGGRTPVGGYGGRVYFRIHRPAAGTKYWYFVSFDGVVWLPLGGKDNSVTYDNIWIFCDCKAAFGDPVPIQAIDWIREGGGGIDPW